MKRFLFIITLVLCLHTAISLAARPDEMLADPMLEARAREISKELRCPVCQNQSIDDSDADLSHDLRVLVRQRLEKGDTDAQVKQYIVARYGTYVLLNPPFDNTTILLWTGPVLLLIFAFLLTRGFFKSKPLDTIEIDLLEEEKNRVAKMIAEEDERDEEDAK
jgi:cytochrome c-type biogenesis protein CcmH